MKIALIGYGKMGKTIEEIALTRGHEIVSIVDAGNQEEFESERFASADVAIEFSAPTEAKNNFRRAWQAGLPVVSGTTGWTIDIDKLQEEIDEKNATLFWTSNFSLGANIFFELNKHLARIMNGFPDYDVSMEEIHHTEKKDAPSGTAITLAEDIIAAIDRKSDWQEEHDNQPEYILPIKSLRIGKVPGTHTIVYDSDVDRIMITHEAKSREGLALGAIIAAEFTAGKKGLLGMDDLLRF